jgi:two-component system, sporulation sensor kinase E
MSFIDLTDPNDGTAHMEVIENALQEPGAATRIEKRYVCKNGATVWVSINIATVTNKKGGPVYFVSQFEDITERKKAEKHLKDAYKQIQDHVNSIKEIAWQQSHLIRSPLANLKGLVEILKAEPSEQEALQYVQMELERLDAAILEMAEDACTNGATGLVVSKRCLMLPRKKISVH